MLEMQHIIIKPTAKLKGNIVSDQSSLGDLWIAKGQKLLQMNNENSDQTVQMHNLI